MKTFLNKDSIILPISEIKCMKRDYPEFKTPTDAIILLEIDNNVHMYCGIFPSIEEAEKTRKHNPTMTMYRIFPI